LNARKHADGAILSIDVFDASGLIAYSTGQDRIGQIAPSDWMNAIRQQHNLKSNLLLNLLWRVWGEDVSVAGTAVSNSFGQLKGYVAVSYSAAEGRIAREQMRFSLAPIALVTFGATALLLFVVMTSLAKRFEGEVVLACEYIETANKPHQLHDGWDILIAPVIARFTETQNALHNWRHAGHSTPPQNVRNVHR
ncbi:MAG: hypothetical protein WCL29_08330, partial [Pseudomonadota bacterium]